ncbi:MAG: prepilin-type N-terminal cleavage/methylation domain-containing protein [Puniceicoccales bacterium]
MKSSNNSADRNSLSAFSLVELLVCIAVLAALAAIIFPALSFARESSMMSRCASNLRQLSAGVLLWSNENKGRMPTGWNPERQRVWQWDVAYVLNLTESQTDTPENANQLRGKDAVGSVFECPLLSRDDLASSGSTSYALNRDAISAFDSGSREVVRGSIPLSLVEDATITVMLCDHNAWNTDRLAPLFDYSPGGIAFRHKMSGSNVGTPEIVEFEGGIRSYGDGYANFVFFDGHVESLRPMELLNGNYKFSP